MKRLLAMLLVFAALFGCAEPVQSSFGLEPAQRATLTLMPRTVEVLLINRGPGAIEVATEDYRLQRETAVSMASGERQTFRGSSIARIRFANGSDRRALVEFRLWGDGATGFQLDVVPPLPQPPQEQE